MTRTIEKPRELTTAEAEEERVLKAQEEEKKLQAIIDSENVREFITRHGGSQLNIGGWLYLSDGARCSPDGMIRYEPPQNGVQRAKFIKVYLQEAVLIARENFRKYKQSCYDGDYMARRYANVPGCPPDAPRVLGELRLKVKLLEFQIRQIDKYLESRYPPLKPGERDIRAENDRREAELIARVKGITLD